MKNTFFHIKKNFVTYIPSVLIEVMFFEPYVLKALYISRWIMSVVYISSTIYYSINVIFDYYLNFTS